MRSIFSNHYSVITFATNKLSYMQFALNCAQSVLLHNEIQIFIVSNLDVQIPDSLKKKVTIIKSAAEHAALGIGMKLYINEYLQTENSLFIDSDCLCFGSLEPVFNACAEKNVSVAGTMVNAADWCGEQQAKVIEDNFAIQQLPRFNGGLYFLKKSAETNRLFNFARNIIPDYERYGFRLIGKKWINEEGLIAISMVKYNETPIADDGHFMTDLFTDFRPPVLNVLKGTRELRNPAIGKPRHRAWYPSVYSPIILHFGGNNISSYPYKSQAILLKLYGMKFPVWLATLLVAIFTHIPYKSYHWLIGLLRKLKTR